MAYKINHADILDWAKNYDGEPFDGILCDPPYELGFMGKSWDSTGIAFNVELWTELLRICKPGAHLLAFSGSRTYHRMACAIEDAGFEIRDMIEWVYGSGFPKSLNIGKAVDKVQGNEREVTHKETKADSTYHTQNVGETIINTSTYAVTKGTSEWEGYGTALKPAHEPCVLARKPIKGTVANNCLEHGTGGLNIDGTRVEAQDMDKLEIARYNFEKNQTHKNTNTGQNFLASKELKATHNVGRFPANLIHDGSDEVLEVFPETGKGNGKPYIYAEKKYQVNGFIKNNSPEAPSNFNDSGSAARFFYTAKASKSERNAGLEGFEIKEVRGGGGRVEQGYDKDSQHLKEAARKYGAVKSAKQNIHPTVKPLALTKYLATLIKPPKGGRLLVPFSGSGSEMIGALQAGWEYVEGVELTEEYIPIAEARIKYWLDKIDKQLEML